MSNNKLTGVPTSFMRRTPRLSRLLLDNNQLETVMLEVKQKQQTTHWGEISSTFKYRAGRDVIRDDTLSSGSPASN